MAQHTTGRGAQADPDTLIAETIGFDEAQTIMGRWAVLLGGDDAALEEVLLVLTAITFNPDENARQTLLDATTRPLLTFHRAANEALKSSLIARAESLHAAV